VFREMRSALIATSKSAWGITGTLLMFVSPIASLAFRGQVPEEISDLLPYIVVVTAAACMFLAWLISYVWQTAFGEASHLNVPQLETVVYPVYLYYPDSDLRGLSAFAQKAFGGDTMNADIVQYAVAKNCALGLRLADESGRNAGFFDVFHLGKDALQAWLEGRLAEPDLKPSDFEPISRPGPESKVLELIVGAIYIQPQLSKSEPSLAFQFAELAQSYLFKAYPDWDEIRLFATIFSKPGERLATLYGFRKSIHKEHRKGVGIQHDVWVRTIRRTEPPRVVRGLGGQRNVILELKNS